MSGAYSTKYTLAASFKELMAQKPFQKISVGDICDLCGMNRKSFYYHFKDKYDLTNWIFIHEFAIPHNEKAGGDGDTWELLEALVRYFYENRNFYHNAMSVTGQNSFREYFREFFAPQAAERLKDALPKSPYAELTVRYFSDAVLNAIFSWLDSYSTIPPDAFMDLVRDSIEGFSELVVRRKAETEAERNGPSFP